MINIIYKRLIKNAPNGNRTRVNSLEESHSTTELSVLVDSVGIEPTTSRLQSERSTPELRALYGPGRI